MTSLTKYDASTKTASVLNGDGMVRGAATALSSLISASVSSAGSYQ